MCFFLPGSYSRKSTFHCEDHFYRNQDRYNRPSKVRRTRWNSKRECDSPNFYAPTNETSTIPRSPFLRFVLLHPNQTLLYLHPQAKKFNKGHVLQKFTKYQLHIYENICTRMAFIISLWKVEWIKLTAFRDHVSQQEYPNREKRFTFLRGREQRTFFVSWIFNFILVVRAFYTLCT